MLCNIIIPLCMLPPWSVCVLPLHVTEIPAMNKMIGNAIVSNLLLSNVPFIGHLSSIFSDGTRAWCSYIPNIDTRKLGMAF
jgi:hypothetical protein